MIPEIIWFFVLLIYFFIEAIEINDLIIIQINLTLYLWKVGNQQVYYIQETRGAIFNQETIKKNAAVLVYGLIVLVDHVVLVNGEIFILDVRKLSDRNHHDVPQAVAVFHQKSVVRQYVRCREVRMYTYGMASNGTHVLLPDKRNT